MPFHLVIACLFVAAEPSVERVLEMGLDAVRSGHLAQARVDLERAEQLDPKNASACLALTDLYSRIGESGHRGEVARHCTELAQSVPGWKESGTIHNYLGRVALANAEIDDAVAEYREAIRLSPSEETYRFELGRVYLQHERFAEAADSLQDASRVFPASAQIELALGVAYYGQRRFREARDAFLQTISIDPAPAQPYTFLGKMLDQTGERLPEVTERFREFAKNDPQNYMGFLLIAKALAITPGDFAKERQELLRKSISINGSDWENRYELGLLLENQRDYQGAADQLAGAARLNNSVADIHYHLARVYDRLDRASDAANQRQLHQTLLAKGKVTAGMEVSR